MLQTEETIDENLALIGIITKPYGRAGAVKVKSLTDFPTRFQHLKRVFLVSKNGDIKKSAIENVKIKNNDTIIIKFISINSIFDAYKITGFEMAVNRKDCAELPPDLYYVFHLVGMQVVLSHGEIIGTIADIATNSPQDLSIVNTVSGKNVLVPFVKEIVPEVLMSEKKVVVKTSQDFLMRNSCAFRLSDSFS